MATDVRMRISVFLVTWSLVFSLVACFDLTTSNVKVFPECSRWTAEFELDVTGEELADSNYTAHIRLRSADQIQTRELCIVDLTSQSTNDQQKDMCNVVKHEVNTTLYSVVVSRAYVDVSVIPNTLEAVLTLPINPNVSLDVGYIQKVSNVGKIPSGEPYKPPKFTYRLEGALAESFKSNDSLPIACPNKTTRVEFCVDSATHNLSYAAFRDQNKYYAPFDIGYKCVNTYVTYSLTPIDVKLFYKDTTQCQHSGIFDAIIDKRPIEMCSSDKYVCIRNSGSKPREFRKLTNGVKVMCDTEIDEGGWIVFQRRVFQSDFFRGWDDYKNGFDNDKKNFWLGLDNIHYLCNQTETCQLRVDFKYKETDYKVVYDNFFLDGESGNYALHIGNFTGENDDLSFQNGAPFSTKDKDNDPVKTEHCAELFEGGWWYSHCHETNINGVWGSHVKGKGLNWKSITGFNNSVSFTEMKIKLK